MITTFHPYQQSTVLALLQTMGTIVDIHLVTFSPLLQVHPFLLLPDALPEAGQLKYMDDAVRHVEGYAIRFNYVEVISAILLRGSLT